MKIQIIICGWWYDEFDGRKNITDFIDGLIELKKDVENSEELVGKMVSNDIRRLS